MGAFFLDNEPKSQPKPADDHPLADAARSVYGPDKEAAREFYPLENAVRPAYKRREADLADELGVITEQREREIKDLVAWWQPTGLDFYGVGERILDLSIDNRIREHREGEKDDAELEKEAAERQKQNDLNGQEVRQKLAALYGRDEGEKELARLAKWAARHHPRLSAHLNDPNIGNRADVILPIVEHLRRINYR